MELGVLGCLAGAATLQVEVGGFVLGVLAHPRPAGTPFLPMAGTRTDGVCSPIVVGTCSRSGRCDLTLFPNMKPEPRSHPCEPQIQHVSVRVRAHTHTHTLPFLSCHYSLNNTVRQLFPQHLHFTRYYRNSREVLTDTGECV